MVSPFPLVFQRGRWISRALCERFILSRSDLAGTRQEVARVSGLELVHIEQHQHVGDAEIGITARLTAGLGAEAYVCLNERGEGGVQQVVRHTGNA